MRKVFVLGSINMDYSISVDGIPSLGESKNGYGFLENQGGKGANQAIAVSKFYSPTYLIASLGDDLVGERLLDSLNKYNINTDFVSIKKNEKSGTCIIILDAKNKDNMLIVDRGANDKILFSDFESDLRGIAEENDVFISQLEVNLDTIEKSLKLAKEIKLYTVLNPSPVSEFDKKLYEYVNLLILNEVETKILTNISITNEKDAKKVFEYFNSLGVNEVVITLGKRGSYYINKSKFYYQKAYLKEAVDTTCAGDTFTGVLISKLLENKTIEEALDYASFASSITVSRKGAASSIPDEEELKPLYEKRSKNQ